MLTKLGAACRCENFNQTGAVGLIFDPVSDGNNVALIMLLTGFIFLAVIGSASWRTVRASVVASANVTLRPY